jgi:hypothetical protein
MAALKGNQYARKSRDWESALRRALEKHSSGMALAKIAEKVVDQAIEGEWNAIDEIACRLDGKAAQSIELNGSLEHRHITELSDAEIIERLERIRLTQGSTDPASSPQEPSELH